MTNNIAQSRNLGQLSTNVHESQFQVFSARHYCSLLEAVSTDSVTGQKRLAAGYASVRSKRGQRKSEIYPLPCEENKATEIGNRKYGIGTVAYVFPTSHNLNRLPYGEKEATEIGNTVLVAYSTKNPPGIPHHYLTI